MNKHILILTLVFAGCSGGTVPGSAPLRQDSGVAAEDAGGGPRDTGTPQPNQRWADLVLNEVAAAGTPADWFELFNQGTEALDLSDVGFTDSPTVAVARARFPAGTTLAPGAYLVRELTDLDPGFKLGSDEALVVFAPDGSEIGRADWNQGESPSGGSYARIPNGTGPFRSTTPATRGAVNVAGGGQDRCGDGQKTGAEACDGAELGGASCVGQGFSGGTLACGAGCNTFDTSGCTRTTPGRVYLNEVTSSGNDQIELYNSGTQAVGLSGYYVVDSAYPGDPGNRYDFAAAASVPPGGFLVLEKGREHAFGLGGTDSVKLYDADDQLVDEVTWPADGALVSYCRVPDGTGAFMGCAAATFGAANSR